MLVVFLSGVGLELICVFCKIFYNDLKHRQWANHVYPNEEARVDQRLPLARSHPLPPITMLH